MLAESALMFPALPHALAWILFVAWINTHVGDVFSHGAQQISSSRSHKAEEEGVPYLIAVPCHVAHRCKDMTKGACGPGRVSGKDGIISFLCLLLSLRMYPWALQMVRCREAGGVLFFLKCFLCRRENIVSSIMSGWFKVVLLVLNSAWAKKKQNCFVSTSQAINKSKCLNKAELRKDKSNLLIKLCPNIHVTAVSNIFTLIMFCVHQSAAALKPKTAAGNNNVWNSGIFCWKSQDSGIHVNANWHTPGHQKKPNDIGPKQEVCFATPQKLLRVGLIERHRTIHGESCWYVGI